MTLIIKLIIILNEWLLDNEGLSGMFLSIFGQKISPLYCLSHYKSLIKIIVRL
jgi:hypothetical protein